jgi:alcohol dehydrogenase class IV
MPWGLGLAPLLLTDKGVSGSGLATLLADVMAEGALPVAAIWDEIPADSSTAVVERIARHYRELGCDSLLALGGGSVIDTAKAVNILATLGERLLDYAGADCLTRPLNPWRWSPPRRGPAPK